MKKMFLLILAAVLLAGLVPVALAAGSASLSGPGTVRAGDTITVTFYAGGGIYGGSGSVSYDASQLTLESHSVHIGGNWAVEFSGDRFVFYDNSMSAPIESSTKIFSMTFRVSADLEPGTTISVTAKGVILSDGKQDTSVGSASYSTNLAQPLSGDCSLTGLSAQEVELNPAFSPNVTKYTASVPFSVAKLTLSTQKSHENAKVTVENPNLWAGDTTVITVTVTAENGDQKQYKIYVTRAQDPNYVPSNDASAKSLAVEGFLLSPVFDPAVKQYFVWVPYETETVSLTAAANDSKAEASVMECPTLEPGKGTDLTVTVKAEDGSEAIYTITVIRAPAPEDVDVFLNGEPEPEATEPVTEPTEEPTVPPTTTLPEITPQPTEPETPSHVCDFTRREVIVLCSLCIAAGMALGTLLTLPLKRK